MTQPESDLLAIRDQLTRRIWDMNQISLQAPGYAKGYADGLSEGLVLIDKVLVNPYILLLQKVNINIEDIRNDLSVLSLTVPEENKRIDQAVILINELIEMIKVCN